MLEEQVPCTNFLASNALQLSPPDERVGARYVQLVLQYPRLLVHLLIVCDRRVQTARIPRRMRVVARIVSTMQIGLARSRGSANTVPLGLVQDYEILSIQLGPWPQMR